MVGSWYCLYKKQRVRLQKLVGGQNWEWKKQLCQFRRLRGQTLLGLTFFRLFSSSSSCRIRTSLVVSSSFSRRSSSCCRKNIRRSYVEKRKNTFCGHPLCFDSIANLYLSQRCNCDIQTLLNLMSGGSWIPRSLSGAVRSPAGWSHWLLHSSFPSPEPWTPAGLDGCNPPLETSGPALFEMQSKTF